MQMWVFNRGTRGEFNSKKRFLLAVCLSALLATCDSPDRLRADLPDGFLAGATAYYNTEWFECAVAVYHLDPDFAEQVRQRGISALNAATSKPWKSTPAYVQGDSFPRWQMDMIESLKCIDDEKLQALFNRTAEGGAGYFQIQETNSVTLVAPSDGLVMVGGYE